MYMKGTAELYRTCCTSSHWAATQRGLCAASRWLRRPQGPCGKIIMPRVWNKTEAPGLSDWIDLFMKQSAEAGRAGHADILRWILSLKPHFKNWWFSLIWTLYWWVGYFQDAGKMWSINLSTLLMQTINSHSLKPAQSRLVTDFLQFLCFNYPCFYTPQHGDKHLRQSMGQTAQ